MKKFILISVIWGFIFNTYGYSQDSSFHSIQEVLCHHIEQLKASINSYDNIFIVTNWEDNLILPSRTFRVINDMNAKFLKKKALNFLVEVTIATRVNYMKIDISNFRIFKLTNKKLKLLDLGNRQIYIIR